MLSGRGRSRAPRQHAGQLDDARALDRLRLGEGWMSTNTLLAHYRARGRVEERRLQTSDI